MTQLSILRSSECYLTTVVDFVFSFFPSPSSGDVNTPTSPSMCDMISRCQATACTKLRIFFVCFSLIRPNAIASITHNATEQRSLIFCNPRM